VSTKHTPPIDLSVALLHADMVDKQGKIVTTSLTMIDAHDIARSCRTYEATCFHIAHPSPVLRGLARTLKQHWDTGHGASYNPNRTDALSRLDLSASLDEIIHKIDIRTGKLPTLIATSAKGGDRRISFSAMKERIADGNPYLMLLGTGHGMADHLLARTDLFLEPVRGPGAYNHLSVRSACAIMLDRLRGM
jgi:hypothetical protein